MPPPPNSCGALMYRKLDFGTVQHFYKYNLKLICCENMILLEGSPKISIHELWFLKLRLHYNELAQRGDI